MKIGFLGIGGPELDCCCLLSNLKKQQIEIKLFIDSFHKINFLDGQGMLSETRLPTNKRECD